MAASSQLATLRFPLICNDLQRALHSLHRKCKERRGKINTVLQGLTLSESSVKIAGLK